MEPLRLCSEPRVLSALPVAAETIQRGLNGEESSSDSYGICKARVARADSHIGKKYEWAQGGVRHGARGKAKILNDAVDKNRPKTAAFEGGLVSGYGLCGPPRASTPLAKLVDGQHMKRAITVDLIDKIEMKVARNIVVFQS